MYVYIHTYVYDDASRLDTQTHTHTLATTQ